MSVVINRDFNAWSVEWGSPYTNPRGDACTTLKIVLLNCGLKDTFMRNGRCSKIYLRFVNDSLATLSIWTVIDIYTHNDHQAIILEIRERSTEPNVPVASLNPLWKDSTWDSETFVLALADNRLFGNANTKTMILMNSITEACYAPKARRSHLPGRKHIYW